MPAAAPLRILFALPGLHRVHRGAEVAFEQIARRLAQNHGHQITLIGSGPERPSEPYTYRRAPCIPRENFKHFPKIPYARDHYAWEDLTFAPALRRIYSPKNYDLTVTCNYPYTNWTLRSRRGQPERPPHVFVTQNGDWMVQARNAEFKHFHCDALVCTNPEYYSRHKDRYRCILIPNGVDTAAFHPPPARPQGPPTILIVSALTPSKHIPDAIRAVAQLPDAHLTLAGDGEQRHEIDTLGQQLLGPRYRRLTLPPARMPDLYRSAHALLHMSRDEAFGNIYVEALATGVPIIAHDAPTTRWIVEDQAHLVDTTDTAAVVEAIRRALDDSNDRVKARCAIAQRRFSWDTVARQYSDFFEHVHRAR